MCVYVCINVCMPNTINNYSFEMKYWITVPNIPPVADIINDLTTNYIVTAFK